MQKPTMPVRSRGMPRRTTVHAATSGNALLVVLAAPVALLAVAPGVLAAGVHDFAGATDRAGDRFPRLACFGLLAMGGEEVMGLALAGAELHPFLLNPTRSEVDHGHGIPLRGRNGDMNSMRHQRKSA